MAHSRDPIVISMQRKIAAAKAARGLTWGQIAAALNQCGLRVTATNLMSKQSRCSFRAKELIILLRVLGIDLLDLRDVTVDGLEDAQTALGKAGPLELR